MNRRRFTHCLLASALMAAASTPPAHAQIPGSPAAPVSDANNGIITLSPPYATPYLHPDEGAVKAAMDRVLGFIERETPMGLADGDKATKGQGPNALRSHFRLTSYEWGVTYSGALLAGQVTHDARYARYAAERINFIADLAAGYRGKRQAADTPIEEVMAPAKLDDAGAIAAAFIKAERAGLADKNVRPQIDVYLDWVAKKQFRLADGTLARNRPYPTTLWLDDLYMSVPALAQMGALTHDQRYFDDAVKQVLQFSGRMFIPSKGLYMHGWVNDMEAHPAFPWARANGWALMAMVELLDVLPEDHPGRAAVLKQLRDHAAGLARLQSGSGLWHQLLDRPDTYLETSATAINAYAMARAVNRGWLDRRAYAPVAMLAWNGVSTKINAAGEVEDVCVGTGMGFDPAFYTYRPRSVRAAHGYGPVLLAGAEIIAMIRKNPSITAGNNQGLLFQ